MTVIKKIFRHLWIFLFIGIFLSGISVFRDYGVSVDEPTERLNDILSYIELNQKLLHRTPAVFSHEAEKFDLSTYADRYYGVASRFPLMLIEDYHFEKNGQSYSSQEIYHIRHLYVWLFYVGALICLYFLLDHLFSNPFVSVSGVLMIFLFGRFFASSFYDSKDMVFVSLIIYSFFCVERIFATERNTIWCLLFSFFSALAVTSRVVAAVLDIIIITAFLIQDFKSKHINKRTVLSYLIVFCAFPLYLCMTPASWSDPIQYCIGEIKTFSNFNAFHYHIYYGGRDFLIDMFHINPWDYTIRWMLLTLPIVSMIFAVAGAGYFLLSQFKKINNDEPRAVKITLWIAGCLFAGTLAYQILARPIMYNAWRHSFFLYPLIILFFAYGLNIMLQKKGFIKNAVIVIIILSLAYNLVQIVWLHPFEMVSMNPIGQTVADQYEGDYWGLSGKQAHEWILEHDDREDIKIYGIPLNSGPGLFIPSLLSLKAEDAARLRLAFLEYKPEYLEITDRGYIPPDNYELVKVFSVYKNLPVCQIYKRIPDEL